MLSALPVCLTSKKRPALWKFCKLDTLSREAIQRAGRLIRPHGKLTLSMSAISSTQGQLLHCPNALV